MAAASKTSSGRDAAVRSQWISRPAQTVGLAGSARMVGMPVQHAKIFARGVLRAQVPSNTCARTILGSQRPQSSAQPFRISRTREKWKAVADQAELLYFVNGGRPHCYIWLLRIFPSLLGDFADTPACTQAFASYGTIRSPDGHCTANQSSMTSH